MPMSPRLEAMLRSMIVDLNEMQSKQLDGKLQPYHWFNLWLHKDRIILYLEKMGAKDNEEEQSFRVQGQLY